MDYKDIIELAGRKFQGVTQAVTAAQDDYITVVLNDSRAAELIEEVARGKKDQSAQVLLQTILRSGHASKLLAGLLTEEGKKWSRLDADDNARIFSEITNTDEKVRMRTFMVGWVLAFFRSGEASSRTSPKSSNPNETVLDISNEEAKI
jgi:hypothetical protein